MELLQIPTHRMNKTGELIPINVDPAKLLIHHINLMDEGDWYLKWSQPPKKISLPVNIYALDNPLVNEMFAAWQEQLDAKRELGVEPSMPNPKDAICGYIYNCYSYPTPEPNIEIPPGFIVKKTTPDDRKKFRRICQRVNYRAQNNRTSRKDGMFIEYQRHLISQGIDEDSKEFCDKCLQYWTELGAKKDPLSDEPPSRSREIILRTPEREYTRKAVRERFRYLCLKHPDDVLNWKMNHPYEDPNDIETRIKLVKDFDEEGGY